MSKAIVRCRCGHQVLAKEVLRTDLYERPTGREYVYVKFRCRRCKRLGEAFVAESRWDWSILEPMRNEMSEAERDQFLDQGPISEIEVLEFHCQLKGMTQVAHLSLSAAPPAGGHARTGEGRAASKPDESPATNRSRSASGEVHLQGTNDETLSEGSSSSAA